MNKQTGNECIYHYTTAHGLLGILAEGRLWATHINYMNDKKEFIDAMEQFRTQVEDLVSNAPIRTASLRPGGGLIEHLPKDTYNNVDEFLQLLGQLIYVISFSGYEKRDQLSQWRGYCANGAGFSIGFNLAKLKKLAKRVESNYGVLRKCIYEPREKRRQIERFIKSAQSERRIEWDLFSHMVEKMMAIAPYCKDRSFIEEGEWRLAFIAGGDILFREGGTLVIPYVEFCLKDENGNLPIEKIVIGPTPNMKESRFSLKLLLQQHKISAEIEESKNLYRPGL